MGGSSTSAAPAACLFIRAVSIGGVHIAAVQEGGCGGQRKKSILNPVICRVVQQDLEHNFS